MKGEKRIMRNVKLISNSFSRSIGFERKRNCNQFKQARKHLDMKFRKNNERNFCQTSLIVKAFSSPLVEIDFSFALTFEAFDISTHFTEERAKHLHPPSSTCYTLSWVMRISCFCFSNLKKFKLSKKLSFCNINFAACLFVKTSTNRFVLKTDRTGEPLTLSLRTFKSLASSFEAFANDWKLSFSLLDAKIVRQVFCARFV